MTKQPHSLIVGTAGWSYPHWEGIVFHKASRRDWHPVEILSNFQDCHEINTSFYQAISPEVSKLWVKKAQGNRRFRFTAKMHQKFTHQRAMEAPDVAAFKEGLWPIAKAGRLAAVLMQFPWSFRHTPENAAWLVRVSKQFGEFPLAAEMRHASWREPGAIGLLADYRIGFCNIDQPGFTSAMPATSIVTSKVGYVRLHGRNPANRMGAYQPDALRAKQHDYLYTAAELAEWKTRIDVVHAAAEETVVIFNNDAAGKSVVNALQMQRMFAPGRRIAPLPLVQQYRMALEDFAATGGVNPAQGVLFRAA